MYIYYASHVVCDYMCLCNYNICCIVCTCVCYNVVLCPCVCMHMCVSFLHTYLHVCVLRRWSNTGNTLHQPRPQVVAHKLLGGVDQATLRHGLSHGDSNQLVYIIIIMYIVMTTTY